jgi:hypothetical protein
MGTVIQDTITVNLPAQMLDSTKVVRAKAWEDIHPPHIWEETRGFLQTKITALAAFIIKESRCSSTWRALVEILTSMASTQLNMRWSKPTS